MGNKKLIWTVVVIAVVLILVWMFASSPTSTSSDTVKIGFIGPLTGDAAAYGVPLKQIVEIAVDEINSEGGIDGKQLEIVYEDGTCDAKGATNAAQKLVNIDGIKVILGGLCSGETLGAAPVTEEGQVILFSAASGSPDITNAGDYVFRNFPSDATSGSKVAQAAIDNGHRSIAIVAEQTDYAQAVKNVFKNTYESLGGDVLVDESFLTDSNDFRSQLTKVKGSNPDGIYVVTQTPAKLSLILKQMSELGIDKQLYTNEFAAAQEILTDNSNEIEGAIFAEPYFDENSPDAQDLINKIKDRYGEVPGTLPPVYFATGYDAVYILKESLEECGEETDCIRDYLYGIEGRVGTAGPLTIDANGDASFEYVLKSVKSGQVVSL